MLKKISTKNYEKLYSSYFIVKIDRLYYVNVVSEGNYKHDLEFTVRQ